MPEDKDYKVTDRRASTPPDEAGQGESAPPLHEIDFATFVLSLASSAVAHLHGLDEEGNQTMPKNIPLARQSIDILGMLQAKTKGNLTGEEERLLDHLLYDLRLQFVEATKK